ncbi:hypothetical protein RRG08_030829 [Elysia crispata]|uniref:Uncharacterized protein n=1 Tax=Elysia crispata TaxID=231223 RepID=A0AAE1AAY7_9GAST|nr:hypothetical protein RRG08_030829 [Elysia crispata]
MRDGLPRRDSRETDAGLVKSTCNLLKDRLKGDSVTGECLAIGTVSGSMRTQEVRQSKWVLARAALSYLWNRSTGPFD